MELFAQAGNGFRPAGQGGGGAAGGQDDAFLMIFGVLYCFFLLVVLAVYIMYLMSLSKLLSRCAPRNRTMEPGQVWLNLIPCFNLVWQFITVIRIAETLDREYEDRGWRAEGDFGKGLGITYLCLNLAGIIPYIGVLFGLGALVCWIIYWVKMAGFSKRLAEGGGSRSRRDLDDEESDDDDDRPSRRRRDNDDDRDPDEDDRPRGRDDRNDDDYTLRDRR